MKSAAKNVTINSGIIFIKFSILENHKTVKKLFI
jgi:hypothetical protein